METPLFQWEETASIDSTGVALRPLERLLAGHPYETAGGDVCQSRFTTRITAMVWVVPSQQAGMQETRSWEREANTSSLEEGQRWCEATLSARLAESPTPWTRKCGVTPHTHQGR